MNWYEQISLYEVSFVAANFNSRVPANCRIIEKTKELKKQKWNLQATKT